MDTVFRCETLSATGFHSSSSKKHERQPDDSTFPFIELGLSLILKQFDKLLSLVSWNSVSTSVFLCHNPATRLVW